MDVYQKKSSSSPGKLSILWDKIVRIPRWRQVDEVGVILFAAFVIATTLFHFNEWRFTEEDWKAGAGRRHEMVDDLLDSKILLKKTKEEVLTILGEPSESNGKNQNLFIYYLGVPHTFSEPKAEQLLIYFENNKVERLSVVKE